MALLVILASIASIGVGLIVGALLRHWSAYVVSAVLGPPTGAIAFWAACYLLVEYDENSQAFLLRGLGYSFWVGLAFSPFGTFLFRRRRDAASLELASQARGRSKRTIPNTSGRPSVGSSPMAPRRRGSPVQKKQKVNPEEIVNAYGVLLAKGFRSSLGEMPKHGTKAEIDQFIERASAVDMFTLNMGRSTKELPAAKDDIEAALKLFLATPREPSSQGALVTGLIMLASFQDVEWCKANNIDPETLRAHDEMRFKAFLQRTGVPFA